MIRISKERLEACIPVVEKFDFLSSLSSGDSVSLVDICKRSSLSSAVWCLKYCDEPKAQKFKFKIECIDLIRGELPKKDKKMFDALHAIRHEDISEIEVKKARILPYSDIAPEKDGSANQYTSELHKLVDGSVFAVCQKLITKYGVSEAQIEPIFLDAINFR